MTQAYKNYIRFCEVVNIEGVYLHNNLGLEEQEEASIAFEKLAYHE